MLKPALFPWLLAAILVAIGTSAGFWQLGRAVEKEALLANTASLLTERRAEPLAQASRSDALDLAWTQGRGRFVPGPALLLDNQRRGPAVGVSVFRVFQPDDGRALLVDLGWLQLPPDRRLPLLEGITGSHELAGLLMPPPSPGLALGPGQVEADTGDWLLTRVDIAALSQALGQPLAPRVLRLDPAIALGHARSLDVAINTLPPERHRGYALQWFGLALATLAFALFLHFRKRKP